MNGSPLVGVAIVPVVGPTSSRRAVTTAELAHAFAGDGPRLIVADADLPEVATALGLASSRGLPTGSPSSVRTFVADDPAAIGLLRATDVTPDVRAIELDGRSLFGATRVRSLADWPLLAMEAAEASAVFDPSRAWTLVAGGDVMLDRGVYREAVLRGKGADFPWDGGTAEVASTRCCGLNGARLPVGRRTGAAGAVRELLRSADIALVNLEGPAPDAFTYHPGGLEFSFDPTLLPGVEHAGIDVVSLANNHVSNAGARGISDTTRHLDEVGIAHVGAGDTLAAATRPALLRAAGLSIAFLGYDSIRPDAAATAQRAGTAPLVLQSIRRGIAAARAAGADVVVVVVHWGIEYSDRVTAGQRRTAAAIIAAGADAIVGSHPHWAGAVERIDGRPVLYSLGDLVFELTHDRRTLEGVLADLTFVGSRLVQLELHPTLLLDGAQPNLLDPLGDGAQVLADIARASNRLGKAGD